MKPHYLAILTLGIAASAGLAQAEETTRVYRQGNSTATITQSGDGSTMIRRTIDAPDGQTIVQSQGGNRAVVTQSSRSDMLRSRLGLDRNMSEELADDTSAVQVVISMSPEDEEDLRDLALDEDTTVQALVTEAIQDFLDRNR